jgi:hypothetical protein
VANHDAFGKALRKARLAEAFHLDALSQVKDARSLRLLALRDEILPLLQAHPLAQDYVELAIAPGDTPRLWIDLITSVVIAPDTQTYRLEQDRDGRRDVLFESESLPDMRDQLLATIAHRVIARTRSAAATGIMPSTPQQGYSFWEMVYVWSTGVALGILALISIAITLKILKI